MTIEIRPLAPEEMVQLGRMGAYVYGGAFGDGEDNVISASNRPEWTLSAVENGRLLTSLVDIPFTMRANGNAMPLCGVSTVGTFPEYRRQGLVRRIHTQAFSHMREQGQAVAALWASQAAIYQRYGYAQATVMRSYTIDTTDIAFHDGDNGHGHVERFDVAGGYDAAKAVYIRFIANRMCYLHRARALWDFNAFEARDADGMIHIAISYDTDDAPNGYVIYTLRADKVDHVARPQEIVVRDLVWTSLDAYRSLWHWIARHDLVGRVRWDTAPVDDPAFELFVEPRMLHVVDREGAWFRVVDVARALESRGYDEFGEISIGIASDDLAPWNVSTFALEASPEGAHVSAGNGSGDLQMTVKTLSSLYTGFRTARELAAWGMIEGSKEAVRTADGIFRTQHGPHCPDHF